MNNLVILVMVNAVFWIAIFALIFNMVGRQQNLEEKYNALQQLAQNNAQPQADWLTSYSSLILCL